MKRVFFIFGYDVHSWGEGGGGSWFDKKGFLEIILDHKTTVGSIVDDLKKKLQKGLKSKALRKEFLSYGGGDLDGRSDQFVYFFWGVDTEASKAKLLEELTRELRKILPEVFKMPKDWK